MNIQQVIDIIKKEFQKNYNSGVPKIPPHTHNGVDNLPINSNDIVGGLVTSIIAGTSITISPASGVGDVTINSSGGGGTPGGSNTQVQYNNSGSFGGNSNFTFVIRIVGFTFHYDLNLSTLQLTSDADLDQIISSGPTGLVISAAGAFTLDGTPDGIIMGDNLNLHGSISGNIGFNGGDGVFSITNADTVPTSTPTGGGILYVEAGELKYIGSSGTVTTIAPA